MIKSAEINWGSKTICLSQAADLQEVKAAMREFKEHLQPATTNEIQVLLGELSVSMQLENAAAEDASALAMRYKKYIEAWSEVPLDILQEAAKTWFKTNTFFPPANKILKLAMTRLARRQAAFNRLEAVVEFQHTQPFESTGTQEDRSKDIAATLSSVGKPLFIPLMTEHFESFKDGSKDKEFRIDGPRWNAKTCFVGRPVVISKGYGKAHRMSGVIASFEGVPIEDLDAEIQTTVRKVFGPKLKKDDLIAVIGISHLRPVKEPKHA